MRKLFVFFVVFALLFAACTEDGGGERTTVAEDPTADLVAALEETSAAEAQTVVLTLRSTPKSLGAAAEGTALPPEAAQTILDSSLTITSAGGDDASERAARVALDVPGTDGLEVILVEGDLYLRADVQGLADAFGQETAVIDQFLQTPIAEQAPFLESVVAGDFIRVEGTDELPGNEGAADQLAAQQQQLLRELAEAIRADARVTSQGEDEVGERMVVSIPFQAAYPRFADLAARLGGGLASPPTETEVPEGNLEFDAWVSDGRLAQIELDLVRLNEQTDGDIPEGVEEMVVRMAFSEEADDITAPNRAVTVSGEEIMALIFGGAFGGEGGFPGDLPTDSPDGSGGGAEDLECSVYEDLPPETFEGLPPETLDQLEQMCPGVLPND